MRVLRPAGHGHAHADRYHHEQSDRQPDQQAPHHHIITSDCRQELTPPVPATSAICLLASEVEPLSKTGGLADVAGALTKYLHGAGHDVRTFTPCYASIDRAACKAQPVAGVSQVPVSVGPHAYVFSLLRAELPGGAPVYLIDCPALYARTSLYTSEPDEHLRFLALTRAALTACQRLAWAPQIVHCNDWHTAFAPLFLRTSFAADPLFAGTRSVLTIHNIGYQGIFAATQVADLGLTPAQQHLLHQDDLRAGSINALRHGILYADAITTVSPTHAREICTDEYGMGLQDSLRVRAAAGAVSGILNGVDYDDWDPARDRYLPVHYSADDPRGKNELKRELLHDQRLEESPRTPLVGLVSRLAVQKGIELMFTALPKLLAARLSGFAEVALGSIGPQLRHRYLSLNSPVFGSDDERRVCAIGRLARRACARRVGAVLFASLFGFHAALQRVHQIDDVAGLGLFQLRDRLAGVLGLDQARPTHPRSDPRTCPARSAPSCF